MGAKTVLERGSSHMLYQRRILTEEYRKFGLENEVVHPKVVERELMEYQEADYISIPSHFVKETFIEQGMPAINSSRRLMGWICPIFIRFPGKIRSFELFIAAHSVSGKGFLISCKPSPNSG